VRELFRQPLNRLMPEKQLRAAQQTCRADLISIVASLDMALPRAWHPRFTNWQATQRLGSSNEELQELIEPCVLRLVLPREGSYSLVDCNERVAPALRTGRLRMRCALLERRRAVSMPWRWWMAVCRPIVFQVDAWISALAR